MLSELRTHTHSFLLQLLIPVEGNASAGFLPQLEMLDTLVSTSKAVQGLLDSRFSKF